MTTFFKVSATLTAPPVATFRNLNNDGLEMAWDIERTRTRDPDTGTIMVFGMNEEFRSGIRRLYNAKKRDPNDGGAQEHYSVTLDIGWGGEVSTVMHSEVLRIEETRQDPDIVLSFVCGDGALSIRDAQPLGTSFANSQIDVLIEFAVRNELKVPIEEQSKQVMKDRLRTIDVRQWNNYVMSGDPSMRIDDLVATLGLEWKIHNGEFIVLDKGNQASRSTVAIKLDFEHGLIDARADDSGSITFQALANPRLSPGRAIQVTDPEGRSVGAPQHRIETVRFTGSTSGDSIVTGTARKSVLL